MLLGSGIARHKAVNAMASHMSGGKLGKHRHGSQSVLVMPLKETEGIS